jgi:hypothetical protein
MDNGRHVGMLKTDADILSRRFQHKLGTRVNVRETRKSKRQTGNQARKDGLAKKHVHQRGA